jgi:mRNA interferase RelE/StbE
MDPYEVEVRPSIVKGMKRLPRTDQRRLLDRMEALGTEPRLGCENLSEIPDAFRVRVGDYRIVYRVDDTSRVVEVIRVGQRGSVYRRR